MSLEVFKQKMCKDISADRFRTSNQILDSMSSEFFSCKIYDYVSKSDWRAIGSSSTVAMLAHSALFLGSS